MDFIQLGREDLLALLTFPAAIIFFSLATVWEADVHKTANKPLNQKLQELGQLKKEAEELNYSKTILLHGKKMREISKLEDVIAEMRRRRNTLRRKVVLTFVYYLIQSAGLLLLYFVSRKFLGMQISILPGQSPEEIVMVPHSFTSFWISQPKTERHFETRYPLPLIGYVRSFGILVWYIMCLITCRVLFEGLGMKKALFGNNNAKQVEAVMMDKQKKNE
jgi:uncharacterized membrane protein (DUF106 family)